MSGSITPGGPPDLYLQCTRIAREAGVPPFVDAQGDPLLEALKAQPALVKPNRAELASTLGRDLNDEGSVLRAGQRGVHSEPGFSAPVASTRAKDGPR